MDNLSLEFDVKLKRVDRPSRRRTGHKFLKIPGIRRSLLIAYQIDRLTENDCDLSLYKIAKWLGITYTSIKQTSDLAFLCSKIKEEILLGSDDKLKRIPVRSLRPIVKEIDWQKQLSLWDSLSHRPCPYCAKSL